MLVYLYLLLLNIILFRRNRYTGSRDTINITQKKINLSDDTNQLHQKPDSNQI